MKGGLEKLEIDECFQLWREVRLGMLRQKYRGCCARRFAVTVGSGDLSGSRTFFSVMPAVLPFHSFNSPSLRYAFSHQCHHGAVSESEKKLAACECAASVCGDVPPEWLNVRTYE